jgi:hypothetical protein
MLSDVAPTQPLPYPGTIRVGIPKETLKLILYMPEYVDLNGTARFKNVNNCLNTNICSCLETSGGQSSNLYVNDAHFFNTSVN